MELLIGTYYYDATIYGSNNETTGYIELGSATINQRQITDISIEDTSEYKYIKVELTNTYAHDGGYFLYEIDFMH